MSGWEWIVFIMVVVSIVGLIGWGTFDWISEQAGVQDVGEVTIDWTGWNVDDLRLKVHGRPRLYDWEAEGDL